MQQKTDKQLALYAHQKTTPTVTVIVSKPGPNRAEKRRLARSQKRFERRGLTVTYGEKAAR
jgi:hypothetical protein